MSDRSTFSLSLSIEWYGIGIVTLLDKKSLYSVHSVKEIEDLIVKL